MIPQSHQPDQRGTALFSGDTLRKLATESSTRWFVYVTVSVAMAGVVALGFGSWLVSVAIFDPIESLSRGSDFLGFGGFLLLFGGVFGSLAALIGGMNALQTTLCLLWQRAESHTNRGSGREGNHDRRGSSARDG